ncbi:hypothetical protein X736_33840 [Mesorhizobium sp. L2C089B000]|nr:hypothetical protein X736_33840 [Mesorhizobium sp. L2C089B000]
MRGSSRASIVATRSAQIADPHKRLSVARIDRQHPQKRLLGPRVILLQHGNPRIESDQFGIVTFSAKHITDHCAGSRHVVLPDRQTDLA